MSVIISELFCQSLVLTDAQIKALPTTQIELFPAVPAGKAFFIIGGFASWNVAAGAYTNINADTMLLLNYDGNEQASCLTVVPNGTTNRISNFTSMLNNGSGVWANVITGSLMDTSAVSGKNITVSIDNTGGNLTGGNAANTLMIIACGVILDL